MGAWPRECGYLAIFLLVFSIQPLAYGGEPPWTAVVSTNPLVVKGTIAGQDSNLLLATGAHRTGLSSRICDLLGAPSGEEEILRGSGVMVKHYPAPTIRLGQVALSKIKTVLSTDVTSCEKLLDRRIDGAIGIDALDGPIVELDLSNKRVKFHDSLPAIPDGFLELPVAADSNTGRPIVFGVFKDDYPVPFILCTSFPTTGSIHTIIFSRLLDTGKISGRGPQPLVSEYSSDLTEARTAASPAFQIRAGKYEGMVFSEGRDSRLGLGYLARYHIILDFAAGRLIAKPSRWYHAPDHSALDGLVLDETARGLELISVDRESAAAGWGFERGDILLGFGLSSATTEKPGEIVRTLTWFRDDDLEVRVKRGNAVVVVTIPCDKYPTPSPPGPGLVPAKGE